MIDDTLVKLPSAELQVPETWATLEDFTTWFIQAGLPWRVPQDAKIHRIDNSSTICIFRQPPYQVELYIVEDMRLIKEHAHPYIELIQLDFFIGGPHTREITETQARFQNMMASGMMHGKNAEIFGAPGGSVMYAFQKWPEGIKPGPACAVWKGKTTGPLQDKLIRQYFPDAYLADGYADITRSASAEAAGTPSV